MRRRSAIAASIGQPSPLVDTGRVNDVPEFDDVLRRDPQRGPGTAQPDQPLDRRLVGGVDRVGDAHQYIRVDQRVQISRSPGAP